MKWLGKVDKHHPVDELAMYLYDGTYWVIDPETFDFAVPDAVGKAIKGLIEFRAIKEGMIHNKGKYKDKYTPPRYDEVYREGVASIEGHSDSIRPEAICDCVCCQSLKSAKPDWEGLPVHKMSRDREFLDSFQDNFGDVFDKKTIPLPPDVEANAQLCRVLSEGKPDICVCG